MKISQDHINKAISLAKDYGVTRLILFGSYIESPETAHDLDLACDGVPDWKFFELGARLEDELRIPVDLVPLLPPNRFTQMIEKNGIILL